MKFILLTVTLLVLVACGHRHTNVYQNVNGSSCTTSQVPEGALIECTDGTSALVPNGQNGSSSIVNVVDPCGDGSGPDEILLVMDNGQVIAWYQNLGLSVLQPNQQYRTTDAQQCRFQVDVNGNVLEI